MNKDDNTDLNELTDEMHDKRLEDSLLRFWDTQNQDMAILEIGTEQDFKNHNDLPLARIKRIMKSDEDVRMISAEGIHRNSYLLAPNVQRMSCSPKKFIVTLLSKYTQLFNSQRRFFLRRLVRFSY